MSESARTGGVIAGLASYILWGFLPLYFLLTGSANAWEIVSWRILWSLVFCIGLLAITRQLGPTFALLKDRRLTVLTLLAGVLIYLNWQFYILAVVTGHIVQGSLGYFINPLVTILLGVLVVGERLRVGQWIAIGFAAIAVVVLIVGYGEIPWFSFILAGSFGLYGLVKNRLGGRISSTGSLTFETLWLAPVAIGILAFSWPTVQFGHGDIWTTVLLIGLGPVTAIPLLLFGYAASKVPMAWMGFMQYFAPTIQFIVGVVVMHEPMPLPRLIGFALVWTGLIFLSLDSLRHARAIRST
ncbi:MAG: EamA family transporter RarD [Actinomycetota bacterium]